MNFQGVIFGCLAHGPDKPSQAKAPRSASHRTACPIRGGRVPAVHSFIGERLM